MPEALPLRLEAGTQNAASIAGRLPLCHPGHRQEGRSRLAPAPRVGRVGVAVERMAGMGHSLGGSAALTMPRQRNDIAAVIALESPFLYDIVGVENNDFVWLDEAYPVPVLNIYSDASWNHLSEWTQYARNDELLSSPQTKAINLHLSGAGHFSLTDLPLASPLLVRLLEGGEGTRDSAEYLKDLNRACLAFFDRHLKRHIE